MYILFPFEIKKDLKFNLAYHKFDSDRKVDVSKLFDENKIVENEDITNFLDKKEESETSLLDKMNKINETVYKTIDNSNVATINHDADIINNILQIIQNLK